MPAAIPIVVRPATEADAEPIYRLHVAADDARANPAYIAASIRTRGAFERLFVRVWPSVSAADVVKEVNGLTSHELRERYPVLWKLPSLWTRPYFAATVGNVSNETGRAYIEAQQGL